MSKGLYAGKDILSLAQFDRKSIDKILHSTKKIIALSNKNKCSNVLKGSIIALLFFEPSTRTYNSFSSAAQRLGAGVIGLRDISVTSMVKGETFEDTIRIYNGYSDLIVMRHPESGSAAQGAAVADVPLINAGDGANEHPTQTLLDLYTIKSKFGRLSNLKVVIGGDPLHSRAMRSLALGLSLYSNNTVYFLSPKKLSLSRDLFAQLKKKGLKVEEIFNEKDMPLDAHIWYWNRIQKERFVSRKEAKKIKESFVVTPSFLKKYGNKKLIIMNPLPRIDEISIEVDSDPRSVYFEQAKNGMYVRMALLASVLNKI